MRILLMLFSRNNEILNIEKPLQDMGHDVKVYYSDHYYQNSSYLEKKIDKLGFSNKRLKYNSAISDLFIKSIQNWIPDKVLFINLPGDVLNSAAIKRVRFEANNIHAEIIVWLIDVIPKEKKIPAEYFLMADKVYTFEYDDIAYLEKMYNIKSEYCPVGFSKFFCKENNSVAKYDIVFIGSPYKNRMELLEMTAKEAKKNGWRMAVFGPFFDSNIYFWKKYMRAKKYPNLFRLVNNGWISIDEAVEIYQSANICLNIHTPEAKSMNPRTFDIMAAGAFELIDKRNFYDKVIPGEHLDVFCSFEELKDKLEYYLNNDEKRDKIAKTGQGLAHIFYTMESSLKKILK